MFLFIVFIFVLGDIATIIGCRVGVAASKGHRVVMMNQSVVMMNSGCGWRCRTSFFSSTRSTLFPDPTGNFLFILLLVVLLKTTNSFAVLVVMMLGVRWRKQQLLLLLLMVAGWHILVIAVGLCTADDTLAALRQVEYGTSARTCRQEQHSQILIGQHNLIRLNNFTVVMVIVVMIVVVACTLGGVYRWWSLLRLGTVVLESVIRVTCAIIKNEIERKKREKWMLRWSNFSFWTRITY